MPDTQGQEPQVEGQTTTAMPTETKPAVTSQTQPESPASEEGQLPEDASERTRAEFEKLKAKNRELAEQLRLKEQQNRPASVMDELFVPPVQEVQETPQANYQNLSKGEIEEVKQSLVDRDGYLDSSALERTLKELNDGKLAALEAAHRAEERAKKAEDKIARFEHTQVTEKLHAAYPQANPYSESFDPTFYEHLKKELIYQMTKGETDPLAAAKAVTSYYRKEAPPAQPNEAIAQRQQASAQAGGKRGVTGRFSEEDLVKGTRQGNLDAFGERLRRSGF